MTTLRPFKSTTLEGAFLEAAFLLQQGELNYYRSGRWKQGPDGNVVDGTDPSTGDDLPSYINITIDTDTQRCVIIATLPIKVKANSFGGYVLAEEFTREEFVYPLTS